MANTKVDFTKKKHLLEIDRLKQLRIERNVSEKEVAESAGMTEETYKKYENGEADPPYCYCPELIAIAKYFRVNVRCLVGWEDKRDTFPIFHEQLRYLRENQNISLKQAAEKFGMSENEYYKKFEDCMNPEDPEYAEIAALADYYNVSVDSICSFDWNGDYMIKTL